MKQQEKILTELMKAEPTVIKNKINSEKILLLFLYCLFIIKYYGLE